MRKQKSSRQYQYRISFKNVDMVEFDHFKTYQIDQFQMIRLTTRKKLYPKLSNILVICLRTPEPLCTHVYTHIYSETPVSGPPIHSSENLDGLVHLDESILVTIKFLVRIFALVRSQSRVLQQTGTAGPCISTRVLKKYAQDMHICSILFTI